MGNTNTKYRKLKKDNNNHNNNHTEMEELSTKAAPTQSLAPTTTSFLKQLEQVQTQLDSLNDKDTKQKLNHELAELINLELQNLNSAFSNDYDAIQDIKTFAVYDGLKNSPYAVHKTTLQLVENKIAQDQINNDVDFASLPDTEKLYWAIIQLNSAVIAIEYAGYDSNNNINQTNNTGLALENIKYYCSEMLNNNQEMIRLFGAKNASKLQQTIRNVLTHFPIQDFSQAREILGNTLEAQANFSVQETALKTSENSLATTRNQFFADVIIELLAYRASFEARLKGKDVSEEVISYHEGFIFEINQALKHFPGIKSDNVDTIYKHLCDKYSYIASKETFKNQISNRASNIRKPVTSFDPKQRKEFRALCKLLNDATQNYTKGKAVVEKEFEQDKEKYEKKHAKSTTENKTTFFPKKEEKRQKKALHLTVSDKYVEKFTIAPPTDTSVEDKNPLNQMGRPLADRLKTFHDAHTETTELKATFEKNQENTRNLKRSLKLRISTLLEDYRKFALHENYEDAKHILFAISTLLKLEEHQQSKVKFKDLCNFADTTDTETLAKNIKNGKIDQYLHKVLLDKGYIIPEYNPYVSLSGYASEKIEDIIKSLDVAHPQYLEQVTALRALEENYINKNRIIPQDVRDELDTLFGLNSSVSFLINTYHEKYKALRELTRETFKNGINRYIKYQWARHLPFGERILRSGMDKDLYELCINFEYQIENIRKSRHHVSYVPPFALTLEELRDKYLTANIENEADNVHQRATQFEQNINGLFRDLLSRFSYVNSIVIPGLKLNEQEKKNLLSSYQTAFNKLAKKYNYPSSIAFDEITGKYKVEARKPTTLKELEDEKRNEKVIKYSKILAVIVTLGQVAISFSGALTFIGLSAALQSTLGAALFTIAIGASISFPVTIPVLVFGFVTLAVASHFLGRSARVRRLFDKLHIPLLDKHPRLVSFLATIGLLTSMLVFPGNLFVGLALASCFCLATWKTNYALFVKDILGLYPKLLQFGFSLPSIIKGAKRVMWDKLGPNRHSLSKKGDRNLWIYNSIFIVGGLVGTLVAFGMVGPFGFLVLAGASALIIGPNAYYYNLKKALMIAMVTLIAFTAILESVFSFNLLNSSAAGVFYGLINSGLSYLGLPAPSLVLFKVLFGMLATTLSLGIAGFTFFGFFGVFYFSAGGLIMMRLGTAMKNFFKNNFTDEYFFERNFAGKCTMIATFAIRGILLLVGSALVLGALALALSGKKGSVSKAVYVMTHISMVSAQWVGIGITALAGIVEGCFNGRAIARVFTQNIAGLVVDALFKSKETVYELKVDIDAKEKRAQKVNLRESDAGVLKLTSGTPEKGFIRRAFESCKTLFVGTKAATPADSQETCKMTLGVLKEKKGFHSLWLDNRTAEDIAVFFNHDSTGKKPLASTNIGNLILSNLDTNAIAPLKKNADCLPPSLILRGVNSTVATQLFNSIKTTSSVEKLTIYLDAAPCRFDGIVTIPDSVKTLQFVCDKLNSVEDYVTEDAFIRTQAETIVLNNINAKTVGRSLKALDRGVDTANPENDTDFPIKRIVLKDLGSEAILAATRELELAQGKIQQVEIFVDGFTDPKACDNNGIDALSALTSKAGSKLTRLHFDNVPKYFLDNSKEYQKLQKNHPDKVSVSEAGNWWTKPSIHSDPQAYRDEAHALKWVYLIMNGLGNAFAVITSGAVAFLDLIKWWSPHQVINTTPSPENYQGLVDANRRDFTGTWSSFSHTGIVLTGGGSAVAGGVMSISVNNPGLDTLIEDMPHDSVNEKGIKRTADQEKLKPENSFKDEAKVTTELEVEANKDPDAVHATTDKRVKSSATKYGHATNRHHYFHQKKAEKVLEECVTDFGLKTR